MLKTRFQTDSPRCRVIFPDWSGARPFGFHIMEELLNARRESMFPTNGAGPDEDVNVYLAGLLTRFLDGSVDRRVMWGAGPLLHPPGKELGRRARSAWYRANGDHRLLFLGLMDRGDGIRRRPIPYGMTAGENRDRDLGIGRGCFGMAANLLDSRGDSPDGLVRVWRKLENNFEDYVHVLGVLATRRLGLGAVLSDSDLAGLMAQAG
jgi:hypothetical protein